MFETTVVASPPLPPNHCINKWLAWLRRLVLRLRYKHPLARFRKVKCLYGINI